MKKELSAMPVTLTIMFIWLVVWILTLLSKHIASTLYSGKYPIFPFINITTVVIHAIAFILGAFTAQLCYLFKAHLYKNIYF